MSRQLIAGLQCVFERLREAFSHRHARRLEDTLPEPRLFLGPF